MEKNDREKDMLYEWGKSNGRVYRFQDVDESKETYFIQREADQGEDSYIRPYGFETLPELMTELNKLWGSEETMEYAKKIIGVGAMKNKVASPLMEGEEVLTRKEKGTDRKNKLPMYIYNF